MLSSIIPRSVYQSRRYKKARDGLHEFLSKERVMTILTILPAFGLFTALTVLPIGWAIYAGFFDIHALSPEWTFIGIGNYSTILKEPALWNSLARSVVFAVGSVAVQLAAGIGIALLINKKFKFSTLIRAIVFLPYLIPTAVLGFLALWMGNSQWGVVNAILLDLGIINDFKPWYASLKWTMPAVILTNSWKFSIFVTIMVLARLQSIPPGYYEAAKMSGANTYQQFRDITLPNLKNVILIVLLLRGVWMFNKFDIIWVLTAGGPGEITTTAPIFAYERAFLDYSLGEAAAVSTLLFLLLAIAALIYFKMFKPHEEVRVQ